MPWPHLCEYAKNQESEAVGANISKMGLDIARANVPFERFFQGWALGFVGRVWMIGSKATEHKLFELFNSFRV